MQDNNLDESDFTEFLMLQPVQKRALSARLTPAHGNAITRLMRRLLADLNQYYPVEKASLALYDPDNDRLSVSHLYLDGRFKTGLTLALPDHRSLLYQVLQQGFPIADNYPEQVAAGIVERKILLGNHTRAVLIVPLIRDGNRLGVLSLASPKDSAFSIYIDGVGETVVARFAADLEDTFSEPANAG
jgi:GAF domain-containing protein